MNHEVHDRFDLDLLLRLLYRLALPIGATVALTSWLLLRPAPGSEALPAVALLALLLALLHTFGALPRRTLDILLFLGAGAFLLIDAAPQLIGRNDDPASLLRSAVWFPGFSALPLLLFGRTAGRWLAALPSALLLLLWAIGLPAGFEQDTSALLLQVVTASILTALLLDRALSSPPGGDSEATGEDTLGSLLDEGSLTIRLERAARDPDSRFTLILLAIDNFNYLSGEIGPDGTEGVLRAVADFLENGVREAERVARWSDDSFMILVSQADAPEAATLAERLRRGMMRVPVSGLPRLTVSIGIASRSPGEPVENVIARTEKATETARRGGGDQVMLDAGGGD